MLDLQCDPHELWCIGCLQVAAARAASKKDKQSTFEGVDKSLIGVQGPRSVALTSSWAKCERGRLLGKRVCVHLRMCVGARPAEEQQQVLELYGGSKHTTTGCAGAGSQLPLQPQLPMPIPVPHCVSYCNFDSRSPDLPGNLCDTCLAKPDLHVLRPVS